MRAFRSLVLAAASLCSMAAADAPLEIIVHKAAAGEFQVDARNVSGKPLVAYVVVLKSTDGTFMRVEHGVYTEDDVLPAGATVHLKPFSNRDTPIVTVDYVRLADGWSWGDQSTDSAKEIAGRFRK
jgi:hypothetical protein